MSDHKHKWILVRREPKGKFVYSFWQCINPNCPQRDKMTIKRRKGNGDK